MAKQIKTLQCHTGRKEYLKILKNFRQTGLIADFIPLKSITNDINCFQIYLKEDQMDFRINIFKSKFEGEVNLAEDKYAVASITVGACVEPRKFTSFLRDHIKDRLFGRYVENEFVRCGLKIVKLPNSHILSIKRVSTIEEDLNGIDCWVQYKSKGNPHKFLEYPLQIKTSRRGQTEHRKSFPSIPSVIFIPKERYWQNLDNIKNILEDIGENFINKKIIHFDRLEQK